MMPLPHDSDSLRYDDPVVFVTGPLGIIGSAETVGAGDIGRYIGPTTDPGWHLIDVSADGAGEALVPVMIEMVRRRRA